jgi:hypothetical protein
MGPPEHVVWEGLVERCVQRFERASDSSVVAQSHEAYLGRLIGFPCSDSGMVRSDVGKKTVAGGSKADLQAARGGAGSAVDIRTVALGKECGESVTIGRQRQAALAKPEPPESVDHEVADREEREKVRLSAVRDPAIHVLAVSWVILEELTGRRVVSGRRNSHSLESCRPRVKILCERHHRMIPRFGARSEESGGNLDDLTLHCEDRR